MRTLQTREDQDGKEIEAPVKMPEEKQEKVEKIEKIDAKQRGGRSVCLVEGRVHARGVEAAANVLHVCYVEDSSSWKLEKSQWKSSRACGARTRSRTVASRTHGAGALASLSRCSCGPDADWRRPDLPTTLGVVAEGVRPGCMAWFYHASPCVKIGLRA